LDASITPTRLADLLRDRSGSSEGTTEVPIPNRDTVLLETVKTQRTRLLAAFLFGPLAQRRVANDNVKRLIGGVVLAATLCAGCVGFSFVSSFLAGQASAEQQQAGLGPATGPAFAADAFDRRVSTGWGSADPGRCWDRPRTTRSHPVPERWRYPSANQEAATSVRCRTGRTSL
jgi:uncharacterized protein (DUF2336 family)